MSDYSDDYPRAIVPVGHVEPVPRRIRGLLAGKVVLDTVRARYAWEWPYYPAFYIPLADVAEGVLVEGQPPQRLEWGVARRSGLRVGAEYRPACAWVYAADAGRGLADTARFDWEALDAWFEEDEEVFVHPRNPYARVDALRSTRRARIEVAGVPVAESASPVLVFETGLPTRYYLNRTEVDFNRLVPSKTQTACPYKGRTSAYWSVRVNGTTHPDLAWSYDYPTRQLQPIAGLVAFYNEKVDVVLDGERLPRPVTPFSDS